MGLDAYVCCDCFERDTLRTAPRPEWGVHVDEYGGRSCTTENLDEQIEFDAWNFAACKHEWGRLLDHRIGNISLIGLFREMLAPVANRLPVICTKVIYSGSHGGDMLSLEDVARLRDEVKLLVELHVPNARNEAFLRGFETQLRELADCSLRVLKPIVF